MSAIEITFTPATVGAGLTRDVSLMLTPSGHQRQGLKSGDLPGLAARAHDDAVTKVRWRDGRG
jgi:hypothetical protein